MSVQMQLRESHGRGASALQCLWLSVMLIGRHLWTRFRGRGERQGRARQVTIGLSGRLVLGFGRSKKNYISLPRVDFWYPYSWQDNSCL